MVKFYMVQMSTLRVPDRFWNGNRVVVAGESLPFTGKDGVVLEADFITEDEWGAGEPDEQAWYILHALWALAGVAERGQMTVLIVGDMWQGGTPDLHLWRVIPGSVEISHVQEVQWEPWREDVRGQRARWWKGMASLIANEPLDVDATRAFEPTSFRLPKDLAEAASWFEQPYVKITAAAFDHLTGQGADIFRTPGGVLVAPGQMGGQRILMPLSTVRQEILEG